MDVEAHEDMVETPKIVAAEVPTVSRAGMMQLKSVVAEREKFGEYMIVIKNVGKAVGVQKTAHFGVE